MEISPLLQGKLFLLCTACGICSGGLYSFLEIIGALFGGAHKFRSEKLPKIKKREEAAAEESGQKKSPSKFRKGLIRFIVDFATLTLSGCAVILLCYSYNNGIFRFFCALGWILGVVCYRFLLIIPTEWIFEKIIFCFWFVFCRIFVTFGYPLKKILDFFVEKIKKLLFLCSLTIANVKKKVYNNKRKDLPSENPTENSEKRQKIRLLSVQRKEDGQIDENRR